MRTPPRKPTPSRMIDGDIILSKAEIAAMGLEKAPADIGPSWQEIWQTRREKEVGHG